MYCKNILHLPISLTVIGLVGCLVVQIGPQEDTPVLHWPLCKSSSKSSACRDPESNQDSYMAQLIVGYDNISRYQFFFNEFLNRCH